MTCRCCNGETKRSGSFKNINGIVQRYRCKRCGVTFSEDQPLGPIRLDRAKVIQIVKFLTEGCGIRAVSRLTDCHTHTVLSVLVEIGAACDRLHDKLVRNVATEAVQVDELWSRVAIRQSRTTAANKEAGDFYTFLALTAREKLIVSHYTGKRDAASTETFVSDLAARVPGRIQITSDSFTPYPFLIRKYLLPRLDYAVMQKQYGKPPGEIEAKRRYSPAPFLGVKIKVKAGAPRRDRICTSHVERVNLSVRHFTKRFARLGLGWSRKLDNHRAAISLFVCAYNWCKVHSTLGCTPAVGAKLATETWTIERLIEEITMS